MFPEQKNNDIELSKNWQPSAAFQTLKNRADFLNQIRRFFQERDVLEIETPLLCQSAAPDINIHPIPVLYHGDHQAKQNKNAYHYLQTSPEFAMKRLLASGSGPIFQICKAFRNDEVGRLHNPEFTLLEWYRPQFDHHDLMKEMDELLMALLGTEPAEYMSYAALFQQFLNLNPHETTVDELQTSALEHNIHLSPEIFKTLNVNDWLDILLTHCIEPHLGLKRPLMIYDFPVSKAALAKVREGNPSVAERFEVYFQGIELANGYHELTDADIQLTRFQKDCALRKTLGLLPIPIDPFLIGALRAGLPSSAGVALGVDRLFMLKEGCQTIDEVIAFTTDRA